MDSYKNEKILQDEETLLAERKAAAEPFAETPREPQVLEVNYIGECKVFIPQTFGIPEHLAEVLLLPDVEPAINTKIKVDFYALGKPVAFHPEV